MKNFETLASALAYLQERGYTVDFAADTACLYCGEFDIRLNPEEFHIDEVYRFESDSSPDQTSVLYAITSSTGTKGTLVDAIGAYAEHLSFEMARKIHHHYHSTMLS